MNTAMTQQVYHGTLGRPVHILLVEDSPSDVAMIVAALREGHIASDMYVASDGEEALEYLFRRGEFRDAQRPDLILLDLNMPRKGGMEVLAEIKADPELRSIPVIVLTTSVAEIDVRNAGGLDANGYLRKPLDFAALVELVRMVDNSWIRSVEPPD